MKNFTLSELFMFAVIGIIFLAISLSCKYQDDPYSKAQSQYNEYCIGCHFDINDFMERDWEYGKNVEGAYTSIRYGLEDIGMPSFRRTFSDEEILNLSSYIISKGDQESFKAKLKTDNVIDSEELSYTLETVIDGMGIPWGMTWLPNGDMLITEKSGTLLRLTPEGKKFEVAGVPKVYHYGQGGLLDIELHPKYEENGWIYITYSYYAGETINDGGSTALMRARLKDDKLVDQEILWKASPTEKKGQHFGSRIEFDRNGFLFLTVGDRGQGHNAQDITNHSGSVHRLNDDGSIPEDNPFVNVEGAIGSIYNYGHRNIQGLALHPETGELWSHEHGPRGGDELNIEYPGLNYGWPEICFGINYDGSILTEDTAREGMEQPVTYWVPSIAPCGMDFVEGDIYPAWKGNILVGSLRFKYVVRCVLDGNKVVHQEHLVDGPGRVRNVKMGPDGYIYVAIEDPGRILKIVPQ
ncbi:MAG: PQQ-dependent sugar dehydrogenase [Bacteroidales bacterium]|nr:PQQ-dependent sugar dehydrogenase [Bacteroidales bacterium]MCF8391941.1 PQQ-dependent sugar dehydrogenase [Bacteroidales bacterium]